MISVLNSSIIRSTARVLDWIESMPDDRRIFMTAASKVEFATEVISFAFIALRGNAGVTLSRDPRIPDGSRLRLRFYQDAAHDHKCMAVHIPEGEVRVMAILIAWWLRNATTTTGEFTDIRKLYVSEPGPDYVSPPKSDACARIISVSQALTAFILSEKLKETT